VKKETSNLLNEIEAQLDRVGRFDPADLDRETRRERIRELATKYLAGLPAADRKQIFDEAVLLRCTSRDTGANRSGLTIIHSENLERWPDDVKAGYFRRLVIGWLSSLAPETLQAIETAAGEETQALNI
jgi:hypothetical protein